MDLFFENKTQMINISERLRTEGYTVNNFLAYGNKGHKTHKVEVVLKRKEFKIIQRVLTEFGVIKPNFKIKNLTKVGGVL